MDLVLLVVTLAGSLVIAAHAHDGHQRRKKLYWMYRQRADRQP